MKESLLRQQRRMKVFLSYFEKLQNVQSFEEFHHLYFKMIVSYYKFKISITLFIEVYFPDKPTSQCVVNAQEIKDIVEQSLNKNVIDDYMKKNDIVVKRQGDLFVI